ncbi:hypothetical protein CFP56_040535 [Quercus suber]|uniref:Uncharacterized protein n=1 Tax=Quercus suber TaxID=58331 RepID=A0AAW0LL98_QUESU
MGKIGLFDLEKHFAFHGASRSNRINIAIHMVFVAALLCAICWVASSFIASRLGFSLAWKLKAFCNWSL